MEDKIEQIRALRDEARAIAKSQFLPAEEFNHVTRQIAGQRRDMATVKEATLNQVLDILRK